MDMSRTKKIPEIKSDKEAMRRYAGLLKRACGYTHEEAANITKNVFAPLTNAKKPKTAQ